MHISVPSNVAPLDQPVAPLDDSVNLSDLLLNAVSQKHEQNNYSGKCPASSAIWCLTVSSSTVGSKQIVSDALCRLLMCAKLQGC